MLTLIGVIVGLITAFFFHQLYWRRRNLPPGPFPFPVLGNILMLNVTNLDKQLLELKKQYGSVLTLWLPKPTIIVSDYDIIKSSFIKEGEKFAGRPNLVTLKDITQGNYGLAFSDDSFWQSQRRFALHVLREFGVGRPILKDTIINQAKELCNRFKTFKGEPIDITKVLVTAVGNIIYQLTFGKTTSLDDEKILDFRNITLDVFEMFNHPFIFLLELSENFKFLDSFFGSPYKRALERNKVNIEFLMSQIKEHRETINFDDGSILAPRDYIDAFLIEQKKQNPKLINSGEWSDLQLIGSLYDIYSAGIETIATTLQMLIIYVIRDPSIQQRIHEEIDRVIGRDEIITMLDQTKLPYFNACIQEVQRITTLLPLNLQRRTLEDAIVGGYRIPKGTIIIPQFQSVHMDEKVFANPEAFDPTRFLDAEENFKKDEHVTPFSVGKRACLGESLSKMELFLFGATFFQHFEFHPEEPNKPPPLEFNFGFAKTPKPFKIRILERM